jgi:thiamine-phosphate pyrophosphorylase
MKIEFSPACLLALDKASASARLATSDKVGPTHLLHGLLDEDEGHPALGALAAGVDPGKLRGLFPPIASADDVAEPLPRAEILEAILSHARDLARLHGAEGSVSSELLFLAVLEVDQVARTLLQDIGLDFLVLQERITPAAPPFHLEKPLDLAPAAEIINTARIVDASANRSREALRVLEDYTRFVRGDAFLSGQLKTLRHDLTEAIALLPNHLLLQARDTLHDVGTTISTPQELERASPRAVAQANVKRLQEALRSLEEYGKVLNPDFGSAIEQLRYQSYTLESALLSGSDLAASIERAKLYVLVTEAQCRTSLVGTVREALSGGAQVIQLREKTLDDRTLLEKARDLRKMTRSAGALFIVNDRPDIALLAEADGVHLGQEELPLQEARRILGADALIGISTHNMDQVHAAVLEGASYLGVGPTFPSKTKDFGSFPGLDFVRQVAAETSVPWFALGGVDMANLERVIAAGARRVAVGHVVCAADDPRAVTAKLRELLDAK